MAELFYRFGTATAIGFLIGLQREFVRNDENKPHLFAGVRTFALIALTGCTGALLAETLDSLWGLFVPALMVGALIVVAYAATIDTGHLGATTEVAAIVTFLVGALCYYGQLQLAVAIGVLVTLLLSLKLELQRFTKRLTREDFVALVKFGVITAIILPVLPSEGMGAPPFDVLNPHKIWLMVVLISGLSFLGYAVIKVAGSAHGIAWTGFLGGLASSTAVTLTFSERSGKVKGLAKSFGIAILIAWATMFFRVIVEVLIVNRALLSDVWVPMLAAGTAGAGYCVYLWRVDSGTKGDQDVDFSNPFELGPALRFGALYGIILLVSRIAQMQLGTEGVYLSSIVAGLTDVDAITLSLAELSQPGGEIDTATASRAVTLAAMANTVVKAGIVLFTGSPELKKTILPGVALILAAGLLAAFMG